MNIASPRTTRQGPRIFATVVNARGPRDTNRKTATSSSTPKMPIPQRLVRSPMYSFQTLTIACCASTSRTPAHPRMIEIIAISTSCAPRVPNMLLE
jgi:hypothetical protein